MFAFVATQNHTASIWSRRINHAKRAGGRVTGKLARSDERKDKTMYKVGKTRFFFWKRASDQFDKGLNGFYGLSIGAYPNEFLVIGVVGQILTDTAEELDRYTMFGFVIFNRLFGFQC